VCVCVCVCVHIIHIAMCKIIIIIIITVVLQTARCIKIEVQRETRNLKDTIAEKTKERWHGKRMHGQWPRNLTKSWWILNSHIAG
jgi:hypothetical protein